MSTYEQKIGEVKTARFIGNPWTDRERRTLVALYPRAPWAALDAAFPLRARTAIETRARRLGIKRCFVTVPWTGAETTILKRLFPAASWRELETALPRHTRTAIDARGHKLGLRRPLRSKRQSRYSLIRALVVARREAGLSRAALAELIGVSTGHLAQLERGGSAPRLPMFFDWIKALELEIQLRPLIDTQRGKAGR